MTACTPYAFELGAWAAISFGAALLGGAYLVRKALPGANLVEVPDRRHDRPIELSSVPRLEPVRLRYRRHGMDSTVVQTAQFALDFEATDPALADLVRATAKRLARQRGAITTADIWNDLEANNPTSYAQLQLRPKGINVAWTPRKEWMQTSEWRALGSNKRRLPVWTLREAVAA